MITTIAEVKAVARHIWPHATDFYVTLLNPRHPTSEGYRITAVGGQNHVERIGESCTSSSSTLLQHIASPIDPIALNRAYANAGRRNTIQCSSPDT